MRGLERALQRAGYRTWNPTYPSRKKPLSTLVEELTTALTVRHGAGPFLAVTHSLGGVILRHMACRVFFDRTVMLAPPNQGSRVAVRLGRWHLFRSIFGPAGLEVARSDGWPPPPLHFGVIAGTAGVSLANPASLLSGGLKVFPPGVLHDGTVAVDETSCPGMTGLVTVPATHTWIMNHPLARAQILSFLDTGAFSAMPPEAPSP